MSALLTPKEEINEGGARWTSLCGFSGCKVFLVENNGHRFVRKISKDTEYNDRLIQQKKKQASFKAGENGFHTSDVLCEGYTPSGQFYFDMEYLPGESAACALESLPLSSIQMWSRAFLDFVPPRGGELFHRTYFATKSQR